MEYNLFIQTNKWFNKKYILGLFGNISFTSAILYNTQRAKETIL